jgi:hypothetical protein
VPAIASEAELAMMASGAPLLKRPNAQSIRRLSKNVAISAPMKKAMSAIPNPLKLRRSARARGSYFIVQWIARFRCVFYMGTMDRRLLLRAKHLLKWAKVPRRSACRPRETAIAMRVMSKNMPTAL